MRAFGTEGAIGP